jgi:hypothetical protein
MDILYLIVIAFYLFTTICTLYILYNLVVVIGFFYLLCQCGRPSRSFKVILYVLNMLGLHTE